MGEGSEQFQEQLDKAGDFIEEGFDVVDEPMGLVIAPLAALRFHDMFGPDWRCFAAMPFARHFILIAVFYAIRTVFLRS